MDLKIAFAASEAEAAQHARAELAGLHGDCEEAFADVIVALGGDGFMLQTLQRTQALGLAVYGMNRGTIGFLMNEFSVETLPQRLALAEKTVINPLSMQATDVTGKPPTPRSLTPPPAFPPPSDSASWTVLGPIDLTVVNDFVH